jgi:hypothetical protein
MTSNVGLVYNPKTSGSASIRSGDGVLIVVEPSGWIDSSLEQEVKKSEKLTSINTGRILSMEVKRFLAIYILFLYTSITTCL